MARHNCHAVGCAQEVERSFLMCRVHWARVPHGLRKRVLIAYTAGQCNDTARIKPAWIAAARAAVEYLLQLDLRWLVDRVFTNLPAGYDPTAVKVERFGTASMIIRQAGKLDLAASLATGEVRVIEPPPAAENDPGDEQPAAAPA